MEHTALILTTLPGQAAVPVPGTTLSLPNNGWNPATFLEK